MGKHTPGPWSIIQFGGMQIGHRPTGEAVCTMWGSDTDPNDPKLANARLIAAAPELVEALKGLIRYADAVRHSAGIGKNQLERLEAAKALLSRIEGDA